jgi:hypothetical protein
MIKREELANPASCMNRARENEMVFVLLGRDVATPAAIRAWIEERIYKGKNARTDAQIVEAEEIAAEVLHDLGLSAEMEYSKEAEAIVSRIVENAIRLQFTRLGLEGVEADGQLLNEDDMVRDAINLALGQDTGCLVDDEINPETIDVLFVEQKLREAAASREDGRECERTKVELYNLKVLLNTPEVEDFDKAVPLEAAHQVLRWGAQHDAGKAPMDWFWLVGYLAGKALAAHLKGDLHKAKHHCISTAAALRNWHAHIRSGSSEMRPGISAEKQAAVTDR